MVPTISLTSKEQELENLVVVVSKLSRLPGGIFSAGEKKYIREQVEERKKDLVTINRLGYFLFVFVVKPEADPSKRLESCRKTGDQVAACLNENRQRRVALFESEGLTGEITALAEGMALGSYQFLKYRKDKEKANTLEEIEVYSKKLEEMVDAGWQMPDKKTRSAITHPASSIQHLNTLIQSVTFCRDLVNEPNSHLTATGFARAVEKMAKGAGASVEILNRQKIEALKMGGLLGVNRGSHEPPTFTVVEWKPENAVNKQPIVLVGKGIVFDTGGINLKPGNSMMHMKDDMAGAATVAATVTAVALAGLPVYVVGLMPATDNRPGQKAIVSGDILTMHNGMTVEVVDTDAEGRLILADALSYARKYDPALVIDLATLTGSAVRAIGPYAAAAMQSKAAKELTVLMESGYAVYERLAEFPMWDEYGELIKSDIADLKNLGPAEAGLITAAKFLQHFTDYPYIHLDIAGPAYLEKRDSYRGQGGTGFGVRLLFDFIDTFAQ